MSEQTIDRLVSILRKHLPKDRYAEDTGDSIGTACTCGAWEGNYFADGEAGPFDYHLAHMLVDSGVRFPPVQGSQ